MEIQQLVRELKVQNNSKIVMLVADGLGGLPLEPGGLTELETAQTPNLDALAKRGMLGGTHSGQAGHHARQRAGAFGAVRLRSAEIPIGRGALEATGIGFELGPTTWPSRGNFCHARRRRATSATAAPAASPAKRARRWPSGCARSRSPASKFLSSRSRSIASCVVFRGDGSGRQRADTDPQKTGVPPLDPRPHDAGSQQTAEVAAVRRPGPEAAGQGRRPTA